MPRYTTKHDSERRDKAAHQQSLARPGSHDPTHKIQPHKTQEELWAARIAEEPEIISDIVSFIREARMQILDSPPLSPDAAAKADKKSGDKKITRS